MLQHSLVSPNKVQITDHFNHEHYNQIHNNNIHDNYIERSREHTEDYSTVPCSPLLYDQLQVPNSNSPDKQISPESNYDNHSSPQEELNSTADNEKLDLYRQIQRLQEEKQQKDAEIRSLYVCV